MKNIVNELKKNLKGMKKVIASLLIVCMVSQGTLVYCYADDFDAQPKELMSGEGGFVEGNDDPDNSEVGNINNPVGENATEETIASPSNADDESGDGDDGDDSEEGGDETPVITDYEDEPTGEETPADETPADETASPSNIEEEGSEEDNSDNNIADEPEEGEQQGGEQEGEEQQEGVQQGQQENGEGLGTLFNVQEVGNEQSENNSMLGGSLLLGGNSTIAGFEDYTVLEGSGSKTLDDGKYIVENDITYSTSSAGTAGLYIPSGKTVIIYIPSGKTLQCYGGAASGTTGGGAGIDVRGTLTVWGEGTLKVAGGAPATGGQGKDRDGSYYSHGGGDGAGGGGAAIGTSGGAGGSGAARSDNYQHGKTGSNGSATSYNVGTINIYKSITVDFITSGRTTITGGKGTQSLNPMSVFGGGGGGGGGFRGSLIGKGGSGGGGGGSSAGRDSYSFSVYPGGGGGAGYGKGGIGGYEGGSGNSGSDGTDTAGGAGGNPVSGGITAAGDGGDTVACSTSGTLNIQGPSSSYVTFKCDGGSAFTISKDNLKSRVSGTYSTRLSPDGQGPATINTNQLSINLIYDKNNASATDPTTASESYKPWIDNTTDVGINGMSLSGYRFGGWYKEAECNNAFTFGTPLDAVEDVTIYAKWDKLASIKATTPSDVEYCFNEDALKINFNESYNADSSKYVIENYKVYKCDDAAGTNPDEKHTETTSATSYDYPVPASDYLDAGEYYYYAEVSYSDNGTANAFTVKSNVIKVTITKKTNQAPNVSELGMSATNASKGTNDGTITGFPTAHSFIEYRHYDHNAGTYGSWSGGDGSSSATGLACGNYEIRYKEDSNNKVSATSSIAVKGPAHLVNKTITTTFYEGDTYNYQFTDNSYPKAKYRIKSGTSLPTGMSLSEDGYLSGIWEQASGTTPYEFTVEAYNDVDGEKTDEASFTVTVNDVSPAPVPGGSDLPSIEQKPKAGDTSTGTVIATISSAMEYSIDGKSSWTSGPVTEISNVTNGTTVYIRYKATTDPTTGDPVPASRCVEYTVDYGTITLNLSNGSAKSGYTYGNIKLQATETATKTGYTLKKVEYFKCDDASFTNPVLKETMTSDTTSKENMLIHKVEAGLTVAGGPNYYYYGVYTYKNSTGTDIYTITSNVSTVTIERTTTAKPDKSLFKTENCTKGNDDGKIGGLTTSPQMEYKHNDDTTWNDATTATASNLKAGIWNIRYKEGVESSASDSVDVIVYAPPKITNDPITSNTFNVDDYLADTSTSPTTIYQFTDKSYPTATYKVKSGTLPSGISLGIDGKIAGVFSAASSYTFEISAYNKINGTTYEDTKSYTWTVNELTDPAPSIASLSVAKATTQGSVGSISGEFTSEMEYSIDGKKTWITCPTGGAGGISTITDIPQGTTVYIRYKKGSSGASTNKASKSYSINIGSYTPPTPTPTPSSGGSSGGSGGGGSISSIVTEDQKQAAAQAAAAQKKANDRLDPANATTITMNGSTTQVVNQDAGNVNWVYEPTTNKWKLSISNQNNFNNQLQQENNQGNIVKSGFVKLAKTETNIDATGVPRVNVVASTYFFNEAGEMHIGWLTTGDLKTYYFEPAQTPDQGKMVSGWKEIETKWFYFDSSGALLRNTLTPDGHKVDENGVWVK